ncbi:SRPBCC family protein [Caproiciproducens sp. MSJ-32]|uniref:SRPBCC family protein n=1 Tax=Caproiciproducens sp. MSJ-32 TaxID=2841527 RepID=UPI001C11DB74|nr:SRPBCC family protein [Caproiciproducens sp. MSJ-32]MBU5454418.1 SRPBCC family protein [Caproiciproducens sp. MSJ-32]
MKGYSSKILIDYPIEKVFKVFIDINKREMPRFNKKNPTETSYSKVIKQVGKTKIEMITKVTGYEKDNLYEVTSTVDGDTYISRYEFKKINDDKTEITLTERQNTGLISKIYIMFKGITAKNKLKRKLEKIKEGIEREISRRR